MVQRDKRPEQEKALAHLSRHGAMAALIARVGPPRFGEYSTRDVLAGLLEAIVSQQLSEKAAKAVFNRLVALHPSGFPDAAFLAETDPGILRNAGLSRSKIRSVREICSQVSGGELSLDSLSKMEDEEVVRRLTELWGVGRWTAEMVLIFPLRRPDVWPVGDLSMRRGLAALLGLPSVPAPAETGPLGDPWKPFRSYAAWYLWRAS